MPNTAQTTLVSLFHSEEHATKAMKALQTSGVPKGSIQVIDGGSSNSTTEQSLAALQTLDLPSSDLQVLSSGLKAGGTLIIVRADQGLAAKVQSIFENENVTQIDERTVGTQPATAASANLADEAVIPVIEEQLVVGKRNVERGGVRVSTRVVETPVEEQVTLREEHATFERHTVNRPISEAELNSLQSQSIEIRETDEEAVVGKTARVVEEVRVGKESTERTQQIHDTVRKTQVEVDEVAADGEGRTSAAVGANRS